MSNTHLLNELDYDGQCKTCHYWEEDGNEHSCMCFESPFAADFTEEDDSCNHYVRGRK